MISQNLVRVSQRGLRRLVRQRDLYRCEARLDYRTGLPNARSFDDILKAASRRFLSDRMAPYALVLLDLRGFKRINDRRGLARGDEALRNFALTLRAAVHDTDDIARIGGDEFMLLLRDVCSQSALDGILARLQGPFVVEAGRRRVRLRAYTGGRIATKRNAHRLERLVHQSLVRAKRIMKAGTERVH